MSRPPLPDDLEQQFRPIRDEVRQLVFDGQDLESALGAVRPRLEELHDGAVRRGATSNQVVAWIRSQLLRSSRQLVQRWLETDTMSWRGRSRQGRGAEAHVDFVAEGGFGWVFRVADVSRFAIKVPKPRITRKPSGEWAVSLPWGAAGAELEAYAVLANEAGFPGARSPVQLPLGLPALELDWIDGKTFWAAASKHGIAAEDAIWRVRKTAHLVHRVHTKGRMLIDLKPGNIFENKGEILLVDFGGAVSRQLVERARAAQQTGSRTQAHCQTLGFTAPEVVRDGLAAATEQADVYSLGATLYFLIAGSSPFAGGTRAAVLEAQLRRDYVAPARRFLAEKWCALKGGDSLLRIIEGCLDPDPTKRPPLEDSQDPARGLIRRLEAQGGTTFMPPSKDDRVDVILRNYLERLVAEEDVLRIDTGSGDRCRTLRTVYTALAVTRPIRTREREPGAEHGHAASVDAADSGESASPQDAKPFAALRALEDRRCLALLGMGGFGKSTFTRMVSTCLAGNRLGDSRGIGYELLVERSRVPTDDDEFADVEKLRGARSHRLSEGRRGGARGAPVPLWEYFPIRIVLGDLSRWIESPPKGKGQRSGPDCPPAPRPSAHEGVDERHLRGFVRCLLSGKDRLDDEAFGRVWDRLLGDRVLWIFDGLDEVHERIKVPGGEDIVLRDELRRLIVEFARRRREHRFLLTSRPYAFGDTEWHLAPFYETKLLRFTDPQVEQFVERWWSTEPDEQGEGLDDELDTLAIDEDETIDLTDDSGTGSVHHQSAGSTPVGETFLAQIRSTPRIADLAREPLLLTLLVQEFESRLANAEEAGAMGFLRSPGQLYERIILLLLEKWNAALAKIGQDAVTEVVTTTIERLRTTMEVLASKAKDNGDDLVRFGDIRAELDRINWETGGPASRKAPRWEQGGDRDLRLLFQYLALRTGILRARDEEGEVYEFAHGQIRDYLAACHLWNAWKSIDDTTASVPFWNDRVVRYLGSGTTLSGGDTKQPGPGKPTTGSRDLWREVVPLIGTRAQWEYERLETESSEPGTSRDRKTLLRGAAEELTAGIGSLLDALVPTQPPDDFGEEDDDPPGAFAAFTAGRILDELDGLPANLVDRVREAARRAPEHSGGLRTGKPQRGDESGQRENDVDRESGRGGRTVDWHLQILRHSLLPVRDRVAAGENLYRIGDPRFHGAEWWHLPTDRRPRGEEPRALNPLGFVPIPAGPFLMGPDDSGSTPCDPHVVRLGDFYIARYPVTMDQFEVYLRWLEREGGDPDRARSIRKGDGTFLGFDQHRDGIGTKPAVGITWHAALAYAAWLQDGLLEAERAGRLADIPGLEELVALLHAKELRLTLPSEAEWEKAARGGLMLASGEENPQRDREFPWGGEPASFARYANIEETAVGARSVPGCFGLGRSPEGVEDLSGNVWEWTRSLWGNGFSKPTFGYPYDPGELAREDLTAPDSVLRVVRGGSFRYNQWYARCGIRYRSHPGFVRYVNIGFRLVASPFLGSGL